MLWQWTACPLAGRWPPAPGPRKCWRRQTRGKDTQEVNCGQECHCRCATKAVQASLSTSWARGKKPSRQSTSWRPIVGPAPASIGWKLCDGSARGCLPGFGLTDYHWVSGWFVVLNGWTFHERFVVVGWIWCVQFVLNFIFSAIFGDPKVKKRMAKAEIPVACGGAVSRSGNKLHKYMASKWHTLWCLRATCGGKSRTVERINSSKADFIACNCAWRMNSNLIETYKTLIQWHKPMIWSKCWFIPYDAWA